MSSTSIHNKLAQAQYEELLKARVLNQAKAVHHEDWFRDCTFDVIISPLPFDHAENGHIIASLIVYPVTNNNWLGKLWVVLRESVRYPFSREGDLRTLHTPWRPLLQSLGSNTESAYKSLDDALRVKMITSSEHVDPQACENADKLVKEWRHHRNQGCIMS